ncbi:hypothetical protein ACIA8K_19520 [Catenuloplanes sp. NPDC051500]|uniref:hypothetical protein n=1 Tax=Catenuloplanes sp. NPDC051500 TaxID=3363959 RepID=UPI0037A2DD8E
MRIKARYAAVIAGALAAMALPGTAYATGGELDGGELDGGPGYLRNVGLNGCLTAVHDDSTGGDLVRVKPCDETLRQVWFTELIEVDAAGRPIFTIRKDSWECLELIGEDLPANGRLALRDCDPDNPRQVFQAEVADWSVPTWRVSNPPSGSWLRAYHEHEAPYVSWTKEWPGAYAEWEGIPVAE